MSSIPGKRRVRTITVTVIKNIFEKADDFMTNFSQDNSSLEELSSFKELLVEKYNKIKLIDDDLINLIEDEEELQNEENLANEFSLYFKKNIKVIEKFNDNIYTSNESQSSTVKSFANHTNIKLPPLKLSTFNGKPEEWQTFFENFECAIHNNNDLSPIQKINYLRNLLEGKALKTISGLALTNDNYHTSLQLLKERFSDKQLLISTHIKSLLYLERVQNISNISLLRRIHDNIEVQIRSLENLGIDSTMYGPLLIPIVMQKIPEEALECSTSAVDGLKLPSLPDCAFSLACNSDFKDFKTYFISQLSQQSKFLAIIKFNFSGIFCITIGINKGPYIVESIPRFSKLLI
ncbi:uncharacterized protein LOC136081387 [Hydra vulgaris]|uniref:Uncharacterized protein LOC136081387 n=1 Tax=Hydra vulgaris TaxID=6087 RepID=A0ABM4BZT3_HYDVU